MVREGMLGVFMLVKGIGRGLTEGFEVQTLELCGISIGVVERKCGPA